MSNAFDDIDYYNELDADKKQKLFQGVNIFRGFRFSEKEGITRGFRDLYSWGNYLPDFARPVEHTVYLTNHSFSKVTHELKKMSIDSASVSLNTPFTSAESEFSHEQSQTNSESLVEEYLLSQLLIRKGRYCIDFRHTNVSDDFVKEISNAIDTPERELTRCIKLIEVLNRWGYYVPCEFTLGGKLYSETKTQVHDFSQSLVKKDEFSISFKLTMDRIGAGGAFSDSWSTEESDSTSAKHEKTTIQAMGGETGLTDNFSMWASSLCYARSWDVVECRQMVASPMLLLTHSSSEFDGSFLLGLCVYLLNKCCADSKIYRLQPYINLLQYTTEIEAKINPFG